MPPARTAALQTAARVPSSASRHPASFRRSNCGGGSARSNEAYVGLNDFLIVMAWATQPDPVRACQILGNLLDQCDTLTDRISDVRRHASLLWDLSYEESRRRAGGP